MRKEGWSYNRKRYFREPTIAKIKKDKSLQRVSKNLVFHILTLNRNNTALVIPPLVPKDLAKKLMKKGRTVKFEMEDLETITDLSELDPRTVKENAFDKVPSAYRFGYSFQGTKSHNPMRISLVDCIEAAWIFSYTHQDHPFVPSITVEPYTGNGKYTSPEREGGQFIVHVPSRGKLTRKGQVIYPPQHKIELESIAIADNEHKIRIAWGLTEKTGHSCESKMYRGLTFPPQPLSCAHEIAAILGVIEHQAQSGNSIPHHTTPIAIPTELTVDYYMKLIDNCLVEEDGKLRRPYMAEKEVLLWGLVHHLDHDETFNPQGEKLKNYNFHRII